MVSEAGMCRLLQVPRANGLVIAHVEVARHWCAPAPEMVEDAPGRREAYAPVHLPQALQDGFVTRVGPG